MLTLSLQSYDQAKLNKLVVGYNDNKASDTILFGRELINCYHFDQNKLSQVGVGSLKKVRLRLLKLG